MKRFCILFACLMALPLCAHFRNTGYLYKDGEPQGAIYLPALRNGGPVLFAVQELREHLQAMCGTPPPVCFAVQKWAPGIHLEVRPEKLWKGKQSAQAFILIESGSTVRIQGNTETAVLYGVYQYLEQLGCRWFTPGAVGTHIPKRKDILIGRSRKSHSPRFISREMDLGSWHDAHFNAKNFNRLTGRIHQDYDLWLIRNRLHFHRAIHSGHLFNFPVEGRGGGHGLQVNVLRGVDMKKNPERFPLVTVNGEQKRIQAGGQICFSDPRNREAAVNHVLAWYAKYDAEREKRVTDLDEVSGVCADLSLADCLGLCECPQCRKIAGDGPFANDRLVWNFMNYVASEIAKKRPDAAISFFVPYSGSGLRQPPPDVRIQPNIVPITCRTEAVIMGKHYPFNTTFYEDITAIRKQGAVNMQNYDYLLYETTPQPLNILDAAVQYEKLGYKRYHVEVMQRNEQAWPILWSLAQFAWNGRRNPYEYLDEFCRVYYGLAGQQVLDVMNFYNPKLRKFSRIELGSIEVTHRMLPDNLIRRGRRLLDDAANQVTGVELERLKRFRMTFEMQARAAELYRALCTNLNERTKESDELFRRLSADYLKYWADNDLDETCSPSLLAFMRRVIASGDLSKAKAKGRPELKDEKTRLREAFAGAAVPEKTEGLFFLPENWKFRADPNEIGLKEKYESVALDDSRGWQFISTWNCFEPQGYAFLNGSFWYRCRFKAPPMPEGKKIILRIGSIDDCGDIYFNGVKVASRRPISDWDKSIAADVTKLWRPEGENVIAVHGHDSYGAGGIWRPSVIYAE